MIGLIELEQQIRVMASAQMLTPDYVERLAKQSGHGIQVVQVRIDRMLAAGMLLPPERSGLSYRVPIGQAPVKPVTLSLPAFFTLPPLREEEAADE